MDLFPSEIQGSKHYDYHLKICLHEDFHAHLHATFPLRKEPQQVTGQENHSLPNIFLAGQMIYIYIYILI
jgi:hypothetical protein